MKKFNNMAKLIKDQRHFICKTQPDLAIVIGRSKSFICYVETGKYQLPVKYHLKVAEYLKIKPIEMQTAYINDCIDNYQRSLK